MSDGEKRRFLTVEQVAEELNVGQPLIRTLLKSGELRGIQIGGRRLWRIAAADLEDYVSQAYDAAAEMIATGQLPAEDPEPSC